MKLLNLFLILLFFSFYGLENTTAQNNFNKEEIKMTILKKTKDLEHYIVTITNKELKKKSLKLKAVNAAANLFISDNCIVQVSSLKSKKIREPKIREYLNSIMVLHYSKIEITWYDINILSDFVKDQNGDYNAVVRIYQKFTGYDSEGKMVYSDITTKTINVKMTQMKIHTDTGTEEVWQVLLGNIKVLQTK